MIEFSVSMGRHSRDSTIGYSSIALLQERFRQLERAKVMRQQREILRLLPEAEQLQPATTYEPPRLFFHSELILPPRRPLQDPHYLQPNMNNQTNLSASEAPNVANSCSTDTIIHTAKKFDESDVDTSLHL